MRAFAHIYKHGNLHSLLHAHISTIHTQMHADSLTCMSAHIHRHTVDMLSLMHAPPPPPPPEVLVQLWRPSRDVQSGHPAAAAAAAACQQLYASLQGGHVHHLRPLGAALDVAVCARLQQCGQTRRKET